MGNKKFVFFNRLFLGVLFFSAWILSGFVIGKDNKDLGVTIQDGLRK